MRLCLDPSSLAKVNDCGRLLVGIANLKLRHTIPEWVAPRM